MQNKISDKFRKFKLNSAIISKQLFAGNFLSVFSGQGMNFKELREYNFGDDIKSIDWSATAKTNKTYIKINEEERQQNIVFLVDVSKSIEGRRGVLPMPIENAELTKNKKDIISELCFTVAYSSIKNNDKIGAVFFSEKIEKVIPLTNQANSISLIAKTLDNFEPQNSGTDFRSALQFINSAFKKGTIIFIFSDFFTDLNFEKELSIAAKKFKLLAFQITDFNEENISDLGLIRTYNRETNKIEYIEVTKNILEEANIFNEKLKKVMRKNSINFLSLEINENYLVKLKAFFDRIRISKN
ncbi:MAG: DUF58 domain-containing protein [Firmicutes bacterium]|nr:DUF58 domain-containing protein [Bacillota bacterium]